MNAKQITDTAMQEEYEGKRPAPTFEEIVNMIPEEKRVMISL